MTDVPRRATRIAHIGIAVRALGPDDGARERFRAFAREKLGG